MRRTILSAILILTSVLAAAQSMSPDALYERGMDAITGVGSSRNELAGIDYFKRSADLGYGPARFLTPQQVHEVATALEAISKDDLSARFDLKAMMAARIYPCKDDSELELAQDYFEQLLRYYADAAANGNAMLLWVV